MKWDATRIGIAATTVAVLFALTYPAWAPTWCLRDHCFPVNEFGDWLAGFAQPIALAWLVAGFWLQRKELALQREELSLTRTELSRQADASGTTAEIAKLALVAQNRAFVFHNGCRWISHYHPATQSRFWRVRPQWINAGRTPTRNLFVRVWFELTDGSIPEMRFDAPEPAERIPATILPGGVVESAFYDISADDLELVKDGTKALFVWGIASYRDVFPETPIRVTKFSRRGLNVTGEPHQEWHADKNPLEIMFATFGSENCADEECEE